jgi:AbrB family looped-hinge helix DNA binding protein
MNKVMDVRVSENGRLVLPRSVRKALGMEGGGVLVLSVEGDTVTLTSMRQSISKAQTLYRANVIDDLSSEDFLRDRALEAQQDQPLEAKA